MSSIEPMYIGCESCGVQVERPAKFCDMCGSPINLGPENIEKDSEGEKAEETTKLLESKKQSKPYGTSPADAVEEGWRLLQDGKISEALSVAAQTTRSNPDDPDAWALSAQAKFQWGEVEDAIYEYKMAIRLKPNDASFYHDLGAVYDSKKQWDEALQQFEHAAQIEPDVTIYRAAVGAILVKKGEYREAIPILEDCVKEDSDNSTSRLFLVGAYLDSATENWWKNPQDGAEYCIGKAQLDETQLLLDKAKPLQIDDAEMQFKIAELEKLVQRLNQREFKGSWVVVIFFGLFYIIPGILWWFVNRRPLYKINKDIHDIVELGKADALAGGEIGAYFSLLPPGFKWVAYSLPRFIVWFAIIFLSPVTFFYSLYDNYMVE